MAKNMSMTKTRSLLCHGEVSWLNPMCKSKSTASMCKMNLQHILTPTLVEFQSHNPVISGFHSSFSARPKPAELARLQSEKPNFNQLLQADIQTIPQSSLRKNPQSNRCRFFSCLGFRIPMIIPVWIFLVDVRTTPAKLGRFAWSSPPFSDYQSYQGGKKQYELYIPSCYNNILYTILQGITIPYWRV